MRLAVVICTWNRASMLRGALSSLESVSEPDGVSWEVLVVDNGSTDQTTAVVAAFEERLNVRRIEEPEPGLSHARNRAVAELEADYILWIDDDVAVEPGWLREYVMAFRRWPDAVVFGGPIRPRLEGTPPAWLSAVMDQVSYAYAARDLGPEPIPLDASVDAVPYGANFAVRTDELRRHAFPADLGRRHGAPTPGGEEVAVIRAILRAGGTGRWVPEAGVDHRIGADRQTTTYLRRYASADAVLDEITRGRDLPATSLTLPRRLARAFARELRYRVRRRLSPPAVWVADLLAAGDAWGRVKATTGRTAR